MYRLQDLGKAAEKLIETTAIEQLQLIAEYRAEVEELEEIRRETQYVLVLTGQRGGARCMVSLPETSHASFLHDTQPLHLGFQAIKDFQCRKHCNAASWDTQFQV